MPSFCFIVTEKCNWKCNYCDFPKIKDPKSTNLSILEIHLPYIVEIIDKLDAFVYHIDIAGGEVGLLDHEILEYFFKTLNRKIVVSTNGMFMEKGYHKDFKPFIKEIQWHVHPKPKKIKVRDYKSEIFINKGIVHDNIQEIVDFINENKHIEFNYVEFEFPMEGKRRIDQEMYRKLLEEIINLDNVTQNAKNIIKARLNEKDNLRTLCRNFNQTVVIDMANEDIMFCHRSQGNTIPLNQYNLIKRIKKFPKSIFNEKTKCDSCTRLYAGKMSGNEIETFFKVRDMV